MNKKFIRSSKVSLKFLNKEKYETLKRTILEYNELLNKFIQFYWTQNLEKLPKFCSSKDYNQFNSTLNSWYMQACGKQALAIVRGTFQKQKQRLYVYNQFLKENKIKQAEKLKKIIDSTNMSCPILDKIVPIQLDGRMCQICLDKPNFFDGWIKLTNSKIINGHRNKCEIQIPFKKTRHFNKKNKTGKLLKGVRISLSEIEFSFEFETSYKESGNTIGIDIGIKDLYFCSDGQKSNKLNGKNLSDIMSELSKKKKGSKAFHRKQIERKNYINWSINQLDLKNISLVKRENIKNLRKYKRNSKFMSSWTYTNIITKLEQYCEEQNVSVLPVKPAYTSQTCSKCGYTHRSNRNNKIFHCQSCGLTLDADFNASLNIASSTPLKSMSGVYSP